LSFLSAQYGLACDNVENYEVVLADGSVVNTNANSYTDLFWALKGGGNQFGKSNFEVWDQKLRFDRNRHQIYVENLPYSTRGLYICSVWILV
jgi:hypothetical protein